MTGRSPGTFHTSCSWLTFAGVIDRSKRLSKDRPPSKPPCPHVAHPATSSGTKRNIQRRMGPPVIASDELSHGGGAGARRAGRRVRDLVRAGEVPARRRSAAWCEAVHEVTGGVDVVELDALGHVRVVGAERDRDF